MGKKKDTEQLITVQAPLVEWEAVQSLITSYRKQSKFRNYHSEKLVHLENFQKRLIEQTGEKMPSDYMI